MYYAKLNDKNLMILKISSINNFIVFNPSWYPAYPQIELDHVSCFSEGNRNVSSYFCANRDLERNLFQNHCKYWSNRLSGGLPRMIDKTLQHWFNRWTPLTQPGRWGSGGCDCNYRVWDYKDMAVMQGLGSQNQAPPPTTA